MNIRVKRAINEIEQYLCKASEEQILELIDIITPYINERKIVDSVQPVKRRSRSAKKI